MENVHCSCKAWSESANQIFNAQVQHTLATGVKYTGHQFKRCPWCGRHLTKRAADLAMPSARVTQKMIEFLGRLGIGRKTPSR